MNARRTTLAVALAATVAGGVLATTTERPEPRAMDAENRVQVPVDYERILVDDPALRTEIRALYAQDRELQASTLAKLDDIRAAIEGETSYAARRERIREAGELKLAWQIGHIELGLRIAELNGDVRRATDFAHALDQIRNPETYTAPIARKRAIERPRRTAP